MGGGSIEKIYSSTFFFSLVIGVLNAPSAIAGCSHCDPCQCVFNKRGADVVYKIICKLSDEEIRNRIWLFIIVPMKLDDLAKRLKTLRMFLLHSQRHIGAVFLIDNFLSLSLENLQKVQFGFRSILIIDEGKEIGVIYEWCTKNKE